MLRDITIGQYYQTDSVIHRLDPRVKLMGTLIFIITLFLGKSVWLYLGVTVFLAAVIKLSKVPVKFIVKGLKAVVILILFSVIFNLFLTEGTPVFHIWKLTVTKEAYLSGSIYDGALDIPDYGFIADDPDYDTDSFDGRTGKRTWIFKSISCTGSRNRHDDVDCPALYSDSD